MAFLLLVMPFIAVCLRTSVAVLLGPRPFMLGVLFCFVAVVPFDVPLGMVLAVFVLSLYSLRM